MKVQNCRQKISTILSAILFLRIICVCEIAYSSDFTGKIYTKLTDPISVAKLSYESLIRIEFEKLMEISCKNQKMKKQLEASFQKAQQAVKLYKRYDINYYQDVSYNFSTLKYRLLKEMSDRTIIHVYGNYKQIISKKKVNKITVNYKLFLQKKNDAYFFCGVERINEKK